MLHYKVASGGYSPPVWYQTIGYFLCDSDRYADSWLLVPDKVTAIYFYSLKVPVVCSQLSFLASESCLMEVTKVASNLPCAAILPKA